MFLDRMATIEAIQGHLTPEERERQRRIADKIDPRPDPWWRNVRKEALVEYQCRLSIIYGTGVRKLTSRIPRKNWSC